MRGQLDKLCDQVFYQGQLDVRAVSKALDELPPDVTGYPSVLIRRARHCIAEVSSGRTRYKPLLRYTLKRLVVLLERSAVSLSE